MSRKVNRRVISELRRRQQPPREEPVVVETPPPAPLPAPQTQDGGKPRTGIWSIAGGILLAVLLLVVLVLCLDKFALGGAILTMLEGALAG